LTGSAPVVENDPAAHVPRCRGLVRFRLTGAKRAFDRYDPVSDLEDAGMVAALDFNSRAGHREAQWIRC
jgi:hypothetical protein